jgi:dolichol kinase
MPGKLSLKREILRKLVHISAFIFPLGYYYLPVERIIALALLIPITVAVAVIDIMVRGERFRGHPIISAVGSLYRDHERKRFNFSGATYILAAICLAVALFPPPVALTATAFIIFGDPASAIIGSRVGFHRLRNKSLEGSAAFLVVAVGVALMAPEIPPATALTGAVAATLTEFGSQTVDDNFSVPLVSGLAMTLMLKMY